MWSRLTNIVGILLLVTCFVVSAIKLITRAQRETSDKIVVIRLCHWQLETGMREAFDALAAEYQKLHPHVRIEQTAVPGRVYGTYVRTRLAGNNPPDIVEMGGVSDEWLAQHFRPLGEYVRAPNPYNAGTEFESVPWRETFLDGLGNAPGLDSLQDFYAVPLAVSTTRVFFNRDLYQQITGKSDAPQTYEEFLQVCQQTRQFNARTGRDIVPIAGSRFNANILLGELMQSQTQKLARKLDLLQDLRPPMHPSVAFLQGMTLNDVALQRGFGLMREVSQQMQPGFLQFDRDEAMFYFAQQRALMICSGSWDYYSIKHQSPFEIGLFRVPLPSPSHPEYGPQVLGPRAELGSGIGAYFFVSQKSEHPEEAIDFLRFITSRRGNQAFVKISRGVPVVRGARPVPEVEPFLPSTDGVPPGLQIAPLMWGSGELYRVQSNQMHRLMSRDGGVEPFVDALQAEVSVAADRDAMKTAQGQIDSVRRMDALLLSTLLRGGRRTDAYSGLMETQASREANYYWIESLRQNARQKP